MQAPTQHPTETTPTAPPPQRHRPVWAFAAAFVLILVVVGGAALVLRSDDTQVTDESAPETTVAVTSTSTSPSLVESLVWSRVPHDEAVFDPGPESDLMHSVAVGGPGFVAVGQGTDGAAVWTSVDGITWSWLSSAEPPLGGPGDQLIEDVTAGGPGLVAVGMAFDEPGAFGLTAAVWTSVDGTAWSRVPRAPDAFGTPGDSKGWMHGVTTGGPGLVAVGADSWSAAVWTSPDGTTWTRVPHDPEVFGRGTSWDSHSEMTSVAIGGPGLVAAGFDDGYSSAGIWTSPDGTSWSRADVEGRYINALTAGGPGLVAVGGYEDEPAGCQAGEAGECYATVWTSVDGITWTPVPYDEAVFGGGDDKQMMRSVTTVGSHLVAVGSSVWTSPDGITWTRTFHDPAVIGAERNGMWSVAVGDHGLVAVGEVDDLLTVWTATPGD